MLPKQILHCVGYASGIASADPSCCMGPLILQAAFSAEPSIDALIQWREMLYLSQSEELEPAILPSVLEINLRLAKIIGEYVVQGDPFLVLGGDHTSAIGTWSGAAQAISSRGHLGLIWIDAYLNEIALAALLGQSTSEFIQLTSSEPKLQPQHVCLIGVRDFDSAEVELLRQLGVRVFLMEEVKERGLKVILQEALQIVKQGTVGYGISLDIRALEPLDAPGASAKISDGIPGQMFCEALEQLKEDDKLFGLEIAEFNPHLDQDLKTEKLIQQIVKTVFAM